MTPTVPVLHDAAAEEIRPYRPKPANLSPREQQMIQRARLVLAKRGAYVTAQVPTETLGVLLRAIDKLEADRDEEANSAVNERRHAREQVVALHKRIGPLVAWAARELGIEPTLDAVTATIEERTK